MHGVNLANVDVDSCRGRCEESRSGWDAKLTSLSLLVVKDGRQCIVIPNNLLK